MFKRRFAQALMILAISLSIVAGSFVARVSVSQAVDNTDTQRRSNLETNVGQPYNPLGSLIDAGSTVEGKRGKPKDLRLVVFRLVRQALGLIGITMLSLMLYAGFMWFSAAGDEDKVTKAKDTIRNAVIGFLLITMTYSILTFIFNSVFKPTEECGTAERWAPWSDCEFFDPDKYPEDRSNQ